MKKIEIDENFTGTKAELLRKFDKLCLSEFTGNSTIKSNS